VEYLGIGDWGLGIGDWGLGPIPNPQVCNIKIKYIYIYSFDLISLILIKKIKYI